MGQVAQAGTAVFFADGDAEQAHVAEFAPHVGGEQVVLVDLRRARCQLCRNEGLHLVAQHVDGFAEGEVQGWIMHAGTFCCLLLEFIAGQAITFTLT
ncbi:hypothetical protein D3C78_855480 [compost metagenome]